jgi:GNAT superfamily N-acetyltransferase
MEITIRKAVPSDVDVLVHFNRAMAEETEEKSLVLSSLSAGVRAAIDDASKGFYLLAEVGGKPAGSLLVTTEWSDWRNAQYWWIQSVYVSPPYRRRGVYKALHRRVERLARSAGDVCGLRLYVDAGNSAAKSVYERLGMSRSRYLMFEAKLTRTTEPSEDE